MAKQVLGRYLTTGEFAALLRATGDMVVDGTQNNDNVRNTGLSFPRLDFEKLFEAIEAYKGSPATLPTVTNGGGSGAVTTSAVVGSGYYSVTVTAGQTKSGVDFGEFKLASIGGTVFNDADKNGKAGAGEAGISGATVFLDGNGNGKLDEGELKATTDAAGTFKFGNLGPGAYKVALMVPTGQVATTPDPVTVVATSGLAASLLFGEASATIPTSPVVTATGGTSALIGQPYTLTLSATDPGHAILGWVINWGDGVVQTLAATASQATHIYQAGGAYSVDAAIKDSTGLHHAAALQVAVPAVMKVTSVTQTLSGFKVRFNNAFDPSVINVYGDTATAKDNDDVRLVGTLVGRVRGSIVFDADLKGFNFIKSGGLLVADTYTLLLRSGVASFHDAAGALDGDGDGKAGGYYIGSFQVTPPVGAFLSIPDVVRAPGQTVTGVAGGTSLPVTLTNALHVTRVAFHIDYDPALLTITGAVSDIASVTITTDLSVAGRASFVVTSPTPLGVVNAVLMRILATVPLTAAYGASQILTPVIDSFYGAVIRGESAIQVVGYLGDADGSGGYGAGDTAQVQALAGGVGTGFAAWRNLDPRLIGDVNRDGVITVADATLISQQVAGIPQPALQGADDGDDPLNKARIKIDLTRKVSDFAIAASAASVYSTTASTKSQLRVTL